MEILFDGASTDDLRSRVIALFGHYAQQSRTLSHPNRALRHLLETRAAAYDRYAGEGSFTEAAIKAGTDVAAVILAMDRGQLLAAARFRPDWSLDEIQALAIHLHGDQVDLAGRPYAEHLQSVVGHLERSSVTLRAIAWLHDTIEDVTVQAGPLPSMRRRLTAKDLLDYGIAHDIVDAVVLLTNSKGQQLKRLPEESDEDRADRCYLEKIRSFGDPSLPEETLPTRLNAAIVKRADLRSNSDPKRALTSDSAMSAHSNARRLRKYTAALAILDEMVPRMWDAYIGPQSQMEPAR